MGKLEKRVCQNAAAFTSSKGGPSQSAGDSEFLGDAALANEFLGLSRRFALTPCGHIDVTTVPCLRGLVMQSQTLLFLILSVFCLSAERIENDKGDEFGAQGACVSCFLSSRPHTSGSRISHLLATYTPLLTQGTEIIILKCSRQLHFRLNPCDLRRKKNLNHAKDETKIDFAFL